MKNLIEQLKKDAVSKGLCELWQAKFKTDLSLKMLCKMYIKGIDFCISEDYPTLDFLRDEMKGQCEPFGIFIDDLVQSSNMTDVVLNGKCKAELSYFDYSVCRIYARHDSVVDIKASENAYLTIDCFDNSVLNINATDKSKVTVAQYGNSIVNVRGNLENILIRKMNKKTY
jgi:hypothetical protein